LWPPDRFAFWFHLPNDFIEVGSELGLLQPFFNIQMPLGYLSLLIEVLVSVHEYKFFVFFEASVPLAQVSFSLIKLA
jgi:hypothetical protein